MLTIAKFCSFFSPYFFFRMSLTVEVSGFGLCQTASPYSVLVIGVQQESFQSWCVYRKLSCFLTLYQQLQQSHPSIPIPPVPSFNPDDLSLSNLDCIRSSLGNSTRRVVCLSLSFSSSFP